MPLEVRCRDGIIEIEPAPVPIKLVQKGSWLVAVPERDVMPLTADEVEKAREARMDELAREAGL